MPRLRPKVRVPTAGSTSLCPFQPELGQLAEPSPPPGSADLRDFCRWAYLKGMRKGEIRSLTWETFDRETWTLRLHARNAKTGHGRQIPLEGELRSVIERRVAVRRLDRPLIFHREGQPVGAPSRPLPGG